MKTVEELLQDLIDADIAFGQYFEPVREENPEWCVSPHSHFSEARISVWRHISNAGHHGSAMIAANGVVTGYGEYSAEDLKPILESLEKLK